MSRICDGKFDEAQNNDYYVCEMQPFDADDPMYRVILAREGSECHHHVEFEYYNKPKIITSSFNAKLCAYCEGADGFVDEELNVVWKSVLPICQECRASGALSIARSRRGNGVQNAQRAQHRRLTALASQARTDAVTETIEEDAIPSTTATATTTTIPVAARMRRRGREPREPSFDIDAPRARKTRRASRRAPS